MLGDGGVEVRLRTLFCYRKLLLSEQP
jgi:hypothetical protein